MMPYIPIIKNLGLMVLLKKIFSCFHYVSQCKACAPGAGHFWPQWHNLNKIGRGPLGDAIHTNYQNSRPYGFRPEDFFMFFIL